MREIRGSCLCGKVKYSANSEPAFQGVCHCKNCQKQSGSAFTVVIGVPRASLSIYGPLKTYKDTGDTGHSVNRHFCAECGSGLMSDAAAMPELTFLRAGSLDDTSWVDPQMHIYCDSKQLWTPIPAGRAQFPKMPG